MLYMSSFFCSQLVPANAIKTFFSDSVGHLYAMCVNEMKVSRFTHSIFGLWTRERSDSTILIFGWVLSCAGLA